VWSHEDKEAELHAHFHNILGEKMQRRVTLNWEALNLPQVTDRHHLDEPFTEHEIRNAINELPA
jgi:hypothetical protein